LILGGYALIQMLVAGVHLHRVPAYTSLFLFGLLISAAIVGFLFKDRAFCRGVCPVGLLLNIYGRGGMLAVRAGSNQRCRDCTSKGCILTGNRQKLDARSCPSLLNPPKLNSNKDCLVCGQCFKACEPDNLQLLLRRPFHPSDSRESLASWPLTLFVILVSGFVTHELCTEWSAAGTIFLWIPERATAYLGAPQLAGWMEGVWTLLVFPVLLWLFLGGVAQLTGGAATILESWRRLTLPMAAIVSAGHMAKGLAKINSWAGFLPSALKDPFGAKTVLGIISGKIQAPVPLLSSSVISIVAFALIMAGLYFAIRESRLANPAVSRQWFVPKFTLAALFALIVLGWRD
jgi:hypothetical protein